MSDAKSVTRGGEASYGLRPGRTIVSYLGPYTGTIVVGGLLLLVTNGLDKAIPWLLQHAIDALRAGAFGRLPEYAGLVIGCAVAMGFVRTFSRIRLFNVGRDVEFDLRNELIERLHVLGPSFFRRMQTGEIMSRATNDLGQVRLLLGFGMLNVVNTVLAYIGAVALMLAISPKLTLYALAPYPFFALATRAFSRAMFKRSQRAQVALAALADRAQENLSGVRIVRSFAIEAHEQARFEAANQEAVRRNMSLVMLRGLMWPVLMAFASSALLISIGVGGRMVLHGELTVGQFAAFNAYLGGLLWPTLALGFILSVVQRGRASYARVRQILDAVPEVVEAEHPEPAKGEGALRVDHLSFAYDGEPVLDGLSLEVPAGGRLAVVGKTGSGKSTLAALLARLLPTPAGAVFLDGQDVPRLGVRELRRVVGYAQQEPFLFSTTVARNIALSLPDPNAPDAMDRVRGAARDAAILPEIEGLPEGFDTVVGERGVQLSGGQKQRIALARALLREPRVLVLDDPLSAVDARTESLILESLDRAGEGRTLVLIPHRVAAASRADQIVVLEAGRVVERGTHEELVRLRGVSAGMGARQRSEEELASL